VFLPAANNFLSMDGEHQTTESLFYKVLDITKPIELSELFSKSQPLEVELGAGDGSFLLQWTALHPERNFIGVERLLGRARKIDRKGRRAGLKNLRVIRIEASYFVEFLLPPKSVAALHIYFPDPWPKRKHKPRRLINERFTQLLERVLQPNGTVYLRTDDADYFSQMNRAFDANTGYVKTGAPEDLRNVKTDFERGFDSRNIPALLAAYRLNLLSPE
jgi:tRNA (guanine-N7-)-methyltransferase